MPSKNKLIPHKKEFDATTKKIKITVTLAPNAKCKECKKNLRENGSSRCKECSGAYKKKG